MHISCSNFIILTFFPCRYYGAIFWAASLNLYFSFYSNTPVFLFCRLDSGLIHAMHIATTECTPSLLVPFCSYLLSTNILMCFTKLELENVRTLCLDMHVTQQ